MYRILFLGFILAATGGNAVARDPYINGGHFSALNDEWQLDQIAAPTEAAMSPEDVAASRCDALSDGSSKK